MAKMTLDRAWIYAGETYGPGEVAVPDEAGKAIKAKLDAEKERDQLAQENAEAAEQSRELEMQQADKAASAPNKAPGAAKEGKQGQAQPPAQNPPNAPAGAPVNQAPTQQGSGQR